MFKVITVGQILKSQ